MTNFGAIFKAYDIRGTVPDQFNAEMARRIGAAFAKFCGEPTIVVARDMRASGVDITAAFADGAMSQGVNVIDLGLASTDLMYFGAGHLNAPGAMFTASHNPAKYNGIKMCFAGARPIGSDTGLNDIQAMAESGLPDAATRGVKTEQDLVAEFVKHVHGFVDTSVFKPLKVVADTANGMGGFIVPKVFASLPFDLEIMYPELDGNFPNHPADPIQPENQIDLMARVRAVSADIGLAFDGDADRVFLVDETGRGLSGSTTTAILAAGVLAKNPGSTILHNLICSKAVPEVVRERGGIPIRTKVGHSFIKQIMVETGAAFGGEHSAHYYFRDNFRADSGIIATMFVLEQLCESGLKLSELRKPFERYEASGEINTEVPDPRVVIANVEAKFSDRPLDHLDGLTVDMGSWWFNLRPSNTEPLLRLNLEAATRDECDQHVAEILELITA